MSMSAAVAEQAELEQNSRVHVKKKTPLQLKLLKAARKAGTLAVVTKAFVSCSKQALYSKAVEARKNKDFLAAERHFLDSIQIDHTYTPSLLGLGTMYMHDFEKGDGCLRKAAKALISHSTGVVVGISLFGKEKKAPDARSTSASETFIERFLKVDASHFAPDSRQNLGQTIKQLLEDAQENGDTPNDTPEPTPRELDPEPTPEEERVPGEEELVDPWGNPICASTPRTPRAPRTQGDSEQAASASVEAAASHRSYQGKTERQQSLHGTIKKMLLLKEEEDEVPRSAASLWQKARLAFTFQPPAPEAGETASHAVVFGPLDAKPRVEFTRRAGASTLRTPLRRERLTSLASRPSPLSDPGQPSPDISPSFFFSSALSSPEFYSPLPWRQEAELAPTPTAGEAGAGLGHAATWVSPLGTRTRSTGSKVARGPAQLQRLRDSLDHHEGVSARRQGIASVLRLGRAAVDDEEDPDGSSPLSPLASDMGNRGGWARPGPSAPHLFISRAQSTPEGGQSVQSGSRAAGRHPLLALAPPPRRVSLYVSPTTATNLAGTGSRFLAAEQGSGVAGRASTGRSVTPELPELKVVLSAVREEARAEGRALEAGGRAERVGSLVIGGPRETRTCSVMRADPDRTQTI
ncbi:hypothetical protein T484DRAFT_1923931 [Baffinella frigidus]|nr:hypothetical protein T484DRAFT_1923931 [Cryptophyta sp. CCMP2293]